MTSSRSTRGGKSRQAQSAALIAGVDIGHARTRVVVLDTSHDPPRIVGSADEPTPAGFFFGGRLQRLVEAGAWVRRVLGTAGVPRPERLVFAISPAECQVRRVAVPAGEARAGVLRALRTHPQFRSSGDGGIEWHFDFQMLDAAGGQVLGVAGSTDGIGAVEAVARSAGFPRPVISTTEVALANAWRLAGRDLGGHALLLEGGQTAITIALVEDGVPIAFRRVLLAGGDLDREAGGRGDVTREAAEDWAARVSHEMRMLVGAVMRDGSVAPPVVVCGGLAASAALREALQHSRPGVQVSVLQIPELEESPELAVAFGLAGSGGTRVVSEDSVPAELDGGIHVDLFRPAQQIGGLVGGRREVALAIVRDAGVRRALVGLGMLLFAMLGADLWLSKGARSADVELIRARTDSAAVAASMIRLRELERERTRLGAGAEAVLALDRSRDSWPRLMDRVAATMPRHVWLTGRQELTSVDPATGGLVFVLRGFAGSTGQVNSFEEALRGSLISEVAVTKTERVEIAGVDVIRWEIRGTAGPDAATPADLGAPGQGSGVSQ